MIVLSGAWMLRSLVNIVYNRGPRAEPWNTPIVLGRAFDVCLVPVLSVKVTRWVWPGRYARNQSVLIPKALSLVISRSWSITSNALLMSSRQSNDICPASVAVRSVSVVWISAVSVE